jgi:hypothetical protein
MERGTKNEYPAIRDADVIAFDKGKRKDAQKQHRRPEPRAGLSKHHSLNLLSGFEHSTTSTDCMLPNPSN